MKRLLIPFLALLMVSCAPKDGRYVFRILTTNDVHGHFFDSLYVSDRTANSLTTVSWYVDSIRRADGRENVILLDAGDCIQGDNAAYYYNYVDTVSEHIFSRIMEYMEYDAVTVGNHDIEAGHAVYDRIVAEMDVPFLAANALRTSDGKPYFESHVTMRRHGLNITIIGFTNPNIKNWLSPALWEGMEFESLIPLVQEDVDRISAEDRSDIVIVSVHSGAGKGDGSQYENQGLDLFSSLRGVDFLVCSHDHRPLVLQNDSICLMNSGSHCRNLGYGTVELEVKDGKVVSKALSARLLPLDKSKVDKRMQDIFHPDYQAVKAFTLKEVGSLEVPLLTSESYRGMSDYINLLHTLALRCEPAQISFAAPLTFNGRVEPGTLVYNDLFTIYPFENQLYVVRMTGRQIKDYLEASYDGWINTVSGSEGHLLNIAQDASGRWRFAGPTFNFDSAAGLVYEVDVTRPSGDRIRICSLADGTDFNMDVEYNVAMTSYRASGGGGLLRKGAGIDTDSIADITVKRYPEIRQMLYDYLQSEGAIRKEDISRPEVLGHWKFVPEKVAGPMLDTDMSLIFNKRK